MFLMQYQLQDADSPVPVSQLATLLSISGTEAACNIIENLI
jgi:hypothetical protein